MTRWKRLKGFFSRKKALPYDHKVMLSESIAFRVSESEKVFLERWCERTGRNLEAWIRDTVLEAAPSEERRKMERARQSAQDLAYTLHLLDHEESLMEGTYSEPPPARPKAENSEDTAQRVFPELMSAPRDPTHSCYYLRQYFAGRNNRNNCQGTCSKTHGDVFGLPCKWPAGVANNCPHFEALNHGLKASARS